MTNLHDLITKNVDAFGTQLAVVYDNTESCSKITFNELGHQIHLLQSEFSQLDVCNGVVGVMLKESTCIPAVLLGLLTNDCPFYPLSVSGVRYTVDALMAVGVSHVVIHQDFWQDLIAVFSCVQYEEKASQILQSFSLRLFHIKTVTEQKENPDDNHRKSVCGGLAYCITTSGTTSKPKVVRVPHACIIPNIADFRQIFQLRPGDKVLMTSPLTFDPSIIDIFCTLSSGACLVLVPSAVKQTPEKLLKVIHKRQAITVMQATPSLMRTFGPGRLKQTVLGPDSNLRFLALGGEQFPKASELCTWLDTNNKTCLYNLYGVTEVSCWASCQAVDRGSLLQLDKPVPIGQALEETLIKLSPLPVEKMPEGVTVSPEQEVGEILIGSVTRVCIIDDEQERHLAKSKVVWRHTGDGGRREADGNIYYLGRLDHQVKRLGKRLNLMAIEEVIKELPGVSNCAAVYHQMTLAVFVIVEEDSEVSAISSHGTGTMVYASGSHTAGEAQVQQAKFPLNLSWSSTQARLKAHAEQSLPRHAIPDVFVEIVDRFPLTTHGKLDKRELEKRLNAILSVSAESLSPSILLDLWKTHLPPSQHIVRDCDNFLWLGGDSLSAVRLATALQALAPLSMAHIYDILVNKDFHSLLVTMKTAYQMKFDPPDVSPNQDVSGYRLSDSKDSISLRGEAVTKETSITKSSVSNGILLESSLQTPKFINTHMVKTSYSRDVKEGFVFSTETNLAKIMKLQAFVDGDDQQSALKRKVGTASQSVDMDRAERGQKCAKIKRGYSHCDVPRTIIQRGGQLVRQADSFNSEIPKQFKMVNFDYHDGHSSGMGTDSKLSETPQNLSQLQDREMQLHLKWQFDTHKCVDASPLVVEYSSVSSLFIGSHSGLVSRLDVHTGACSWSVKLPDRVESSACCTRDGRYVVVGCYDGNIYTLCASSGATTWQFSTGDSVKCSPVLNLVSGHILCGSHDGCLYCLDVDSQKCVWQCILGAGSVFASPTVDPVGLVVYAATLGGLVHAIDAKTGKIQWTTDLEKPVFASVCADEGRLLVGCVDSRVYCLDATSGTTNWSFEASAPIFSSPVVEEGHIFFGSHDFAVYCLKSEGQLLWKFKTQSTIYATVFPFRYLQNCSNQMRGRREEVPKDILVTNALTGKDVETDPCYESPERGQEVSVSALSSRVEVSHRQAIKECVVIASTDGRLCVLDNRDGQLLSSYTLPGQVFSSPVVSNTLIIVGCRDNFVYCLEIT